MTMTATLKILILEDSVDDLELIEREIKRGGINFTSRVVKKRDEYEQALHSFHPDVILSDHSLPHFNSIEAMHIWKDYQEKNHLEIPFILITGSVSEEFAVQMLKTGAHDYILKDRLKRLPASIQHAVERARTEKERKSFMAEVVSQSTLMKEAEHLANFGSWRVDLRTGTHQWSDEAFRIFGFNPREIEPGYDRFFAHLHPEDQEKLKEAVRECVKDSSFRECEFRILDKDQKIRYLQCKMVVKRDSRQRAYELIGFTLDITKYKVQTAALELNNQKLREIALVQLHEIMTPLTNVMGSVQSLTRNFDAEGSVNGPLAHLATNTRKLDEVIRKIVRKTEDIH